MPDPRTSGLVLDNTKLLCNILVSISSSTHIPGFNTVALLANQIVDIALAMKRNKEDAIMLVEKINQFLTALVDAMNDEMQADIDPGLNKDLTSFTENLKRILLQMEKINARKFVQRLLNLSSTSQDIRDCENMLTQNLNIVQLKSQLRTENSVKRLEGMLAKWNNNVLCNEGDPGVGTQLGTLQEIPQTDLKLMDYINRDRNIWKGRYDGQVVVVKNYKDEDLLLKELKAWLQYWEPCWLQIWGRSRRQGQNHYLVLQDPGEPVQHYVRKQFQSDSRTAVREVINVLKQVANAAWISFQHDPACRLDTADVHMRSEGYCPVIVDFDPCNFHSQSKMSEQEYWNSFLAMAAKMLTGHAHQPNYPTGQFGGTGLSATHMLKWPLHFLYDFWYSYSRHFKGTGDSNQTSMLETLLSVLEGLEEDMNTNDVDDDNPFLWLLQRRFPNLFGFWDVGDALSVEPGDLGVLDGVNSKRPIFRKFDNIAGQISGSVLYCMQRETVYDPYELDAPLWSMDVLDGGITRHTLRMGEAPITSRLFRFQQKENRGETALNDAWDVSSAWSYLLNNRPYLHMLAEEHGVNVHDIILVFSWVVDTNYTHIVLKKGVTEIERAEALEKAGFRDGVLYYFENISPKENDIEGYWSTSADPGQPCWPPSTTASGTQWAWQHSESIFTIEVSRKGTMGHIRYLCI